MSIRLAVIVEGHGDGAALPVLVRRLAQRIAPGVMVVVDPVLRVRRHSIVKPRELERSVELAARRLGDRGGILILLDADDDCPAQLGPALLERARRARGDLPIAVVLAKREYESWFLAAAISLRGHASLSADLRPPNDPEAIRGAKEWLTRLMAGRERYVETLHQAELTRRFDLDQARQAASFDKLYREVAWLLAELTSQPQ